MNLIGPLGKKTTPPAGEDEEEVGFLDISEALDEVLNPPCRCTLAEIQNKSPGLKPDGGCGLCGGGKG